MAEPASEHAPKQASPLQPLAFVPLDEYARPAGATTSRLRALTKDMRRLLLGEQDANIRPDLVALTPPEAESLCPRPGFWTLQNDLDTHLSDWLGETEPETAKLIVYPMATRERFLTGWADYNSLTCLSCKDSGREESWFRDTVHRIRQGGLVVIPDLHNGFLRRRGGLDGIRLLLAEIEYSPERVVLGCNSWAWQFLKKSVNAHHYLPNATVPEALGEDQLRNWFARATANIDTKFLSMKSEADLFSKHSNFFKTLAAESLGIPWVAWALWQNSLMRHTSDSVKGGLKQVWLKTPTPPPLPVNDRERSLLILQAVLLHGSITIEDVFSVLPFATAPSEIALLRRAGILRSRDGILDIETAAYPSVVQALRNANFPGDGL